MTFITWIVFTVLEQKLNLDFMKKNVRIKFFLKIEIFFSLIKDWSKIIKLQLVTDIDKILMVGKVIRGGICHAFHQYVKANNKYMNDYVKNKESSYLKYQDIYGFHRLSNVTKASSK